MALDYKKLGFKCGIEIHQQLEGKKLFCNCPTDISKEKPDFTVERQLRAAAGESGAVDQAALHEQQKAKNFVYQGYYDSTCLVELDEEPPHELNKEALKIGLQTAHALNAEVVDELQFMRKTVIDGSNTSGFQRTGLVARNGYVEVNGKKIGIPTICLEEEACQVIERTKTKDVFNLSRLGIPLIEIATDPTISSPEECKEVAAKLGMILRSIPGMKRGIGSIRQDVNVSIKEGARTEIKGFQEFKSIPKVIEGEINRQLEEIKKGNKPEQQVRKAEPDFTTTFLRPMPGADRMYPETDVAPILPETDGIEKIELLEEKAEKIKKLGISGDLANSVAKSGKTETIIDFANKYNNVKPAFIAETILATPKVIKKKENIDVNLSDDDFGKLFSELNDGKISKDSVYDIMVEYGKSGKLDFSKYELMSDDELEKEIKQIVDENKDLPGKALIGKAMGKLKGKADGKKIFEMLNKLSS
ncbi:Glu-tRNA(Gln) amidotransferase subunit GatE [Nanoarchaeota archaeon]